MTGRISLILRDTSRWILLFALVYAPWAYGCTTAPTIFKLNAILASALILWLASFLIRNRTAGRRAPYGTLSLLLAVVSAAVLILGWWMVINARSIYDSNYYLFIGRHHISFSLPGSIDAAISYAWMVRATLLLGVVFLVWELASEPAWLLRLWWTIALAGGSIAFLGLLQKATAAEMIFWQPSNSSEVINFFASYYYHSNAGAYLNLILPVAAALIVRAFARRKAPLMRAAALLPFLLVVVATIANTSRMGQIVSVLLLFTTAFYFRRFFFAGICKTEFKGVLLTAGVLIIAVVAIAIASRIDQAFGRWYALGATFDRDARWLASRAALRALGDSGFFGFGPGTFRVFFPYYTNGLPANIAGTWRFLHEDYLQTLLEWGWIGSAGWALIFFGGLFVAIKNLITVSRQGNWTPRQRLFLPMAVLSLAGVALHALVDFPLQIASLQLYVAVHTGICWGSTSWR